MGLAGASIDTNMQNRCHCKAINTYMTPSGVRVEQPFPPVKPPKNKMKVLKKIKKSIGLGAYDIHNDIFYIGKTVFIRYKLSGIVLCFM